MDNFYSTVRFLGAVGSVMRSVTAIGGHFSAAYQRFHPYAPPSATDASAPPPQPSYQGGYGSHRSQRRDNLSYDRYDNDDELVREIRAKWNESEMGDREMEMKKAETKLTNLMANKAVIRGFAETYHRHIDDCRKLLFYGVSQNQINDICQNGFDRCADRRTRLGKGICLSVDPAESHPYARPDSDGKRHMLVCSVAIGEKTKGYDSMKKPPFKGNGTRYDVMVDNVDSPTLYSVYKDCYAVPLFHITYQ